MLGNALFWNLLSLGLSQVFNLTRFAVAGRVLEPEDFGLFGMATIVIAGLAIFSDFGFKQALIVYGEHRGPRKRDWLNTIWTADLVTKAVLSMVLLIVAYPAAMLFQDPRVTPIILALSVAPVLGALGNPGIFALEKSMNFRRVGMLDVLTSFIGASIVISLALWLRSVWALVFGHIIGTAVGVALTYLFSRYRPSVGWDKNILLRSLHFGKHLIFVGVLTYATTQFDNLVIGSLLGAATLGFYLIAYRLSEMPSILISSGVNRVLLPYFAGLTPDQESERPIIWQRVFLSTLCVSLIFYLPVLLFPQWTVTTLFGEKWAEASTLVSILAIGGLLRTLARSIGPIAQAVGRPDIDSKGKLLEVTIFVPGVLFAVHTGGAEHVAWIVVVSYAVALVFRLSYIRHVVQFQVISFLIAVTRILGGASLTVILFLMVGYWNGGAQAIQFAASAILFAGLAYGMSPDLREVFALVRMHFRRGPEAATEHR